MECDREKTLELELRAKLARCRKLAQEFPEGLTAVNIRELETEIGQQLQAIEAGKTLWPRHTAHSRLRGGTDPAVG